jgi:hypothetical protein
MPEENQLSVTLHRSGSKANHSTISGVTSEDLIVGAELAQSEKGREQHLQKQAQAQRAVPEEKMVEAVREVLARHRLR